MMTTSSKEAMNALPRRFRALIIDAREEKRFRCAAAETMASIERGSQSKRNESAIDRIARGKRDGRIERDGLLAQENLVDFCQSSSLDMTLVHRPRSLHH